MNKYQEALNVVKGCIDIRCDEEIAIVQELVDKATPKKPMKIKTNYMEAYVCPNCRHSFEGFSYCRFCGQRLVRDDS